VSGTIELAGELNIRNSYVTIDGYTAPGEGITLKGGNIKISGGINAAKLKNDVLGQNIFPGVKEVVLRYIRIRVGDASTRGRYPINGGGMDCISITGYAENILVDHCSLSWSVDEIVGILTGKNITLQWCIFSEPLGDISDRYEKTPIANRLHPYGDDHAYGVLASACTLTIKNSVFAHSRLRMPSLEANDASENQNFDVKMESVNNLIFDYGSNGGRYKLGIEDSSVSTSTTTADQAGDTTFSYQFVGNTYINPDSSIPDIKAEMTDSGRRPELIKAYVYNNIGPSRPDDNMDQWSIVALKLPGSSSVPIRNYINKQDAEDKDIYAAQMADKPLFESGVITQSAQDAVEPTLKYAGASKRRDTVDKRIINDINTNNFYKEGEFGQSGYTITFPWTEYKYAKITYDFLKNATEPVDRLPNSDIVPVDPKYKQRNFTFEDFFGIGAKGFADDNAFSIVYNGQSPAYFLNSVMQVGGFPTLQSGRADLERLIVEGFPLKSYFNKGINDYEIELPDDVYFSLKAGDVIPISITPVTVYKDAEIIINGKTVADSAEVTHIPLDNNKQIVVNVAGSDGISQTYTLSVVRSAK
jgi:hypothetical protein